MTDLTISGTFGPYKLIEKLGEGTYGAVFRARPQGASMRGASEVALKIFKPPKDGESPQWYARRLQSEVAALQALDHPNIVGFRHAAVADERLYIEMELVRGPSLGRLLRDRSGPLPPAAVVQLALHLCAGLEAAHDPGEGDPVVHRDFKPDNVLISRQGQAKIADFGLAKVAKGGAASMSMLVGSAAYCAPEQLEEGGSVDARTDLFALGVVLVEATLGEGLFPRDSVDAMYVIKRRLGDHLAERDALARVDEAVPGLGAIVSRLLARESEERYGDAWALERALESALAPDLLRDRRALRRVVREWERAHSGEVAGEDAPTSPLVSSPDDSIVTPEPSLPPPRVGGTKLLPRGVSAPPRAVVSPTKDVPRSPPERPGIVKKGRGLTRFAYLAAFGLVAFVLGVARFGRGNGSESVETEPAEVVHVSPTPEPTPEPIAAERVAGSSPMVQVSGGTFWFGCANRDTDCTSMGDLPGALKYLDGFSLDKYEVTNEQYAAFLTARGNNDCNGAECLGSDQLVQTDSSWSAKSGHNRHPIGVTWDGANAYCSWLGRRLPSEEEWELAARGTCSHNGLEEWNCSDSRIHPWTRDLAPSCALAVYDDGGGGGCGTGGTLPVGSRPGGASPSGALDMAGNVWEWTSSLRDGSWIIKGGYSGGGAAHMRVSGRTDVPNALFEGAFVEDPFVGFRCAK